MHVVYKYIYIYCIYVYTWTYFKMGTVLSYLDGFGSGTWLFYYTSECFLCFGKVSQIDHQVLPDMWIKPTLYNYHQFVCRETWCTTWSLRGGFSELQRARMMDGGYVGSDVTNMRFFHQQKGAEASSHQEHNPPKDSLLLNKTTQNRSESVKVKWDHRK